ncbi:MAG TPA: helix-turn-helix domain-containing protein [Candidatus Binataceae bacterium]|nr:helix-turn-helix domain-containing protein [Candidatus Binataceae bacterium]
MKRSKPDTSKRYSQGEFNSQGFADRLAQLIAEYGSRYALAKASGIPVTTLQNYALGSRPGIDALVTLARVGNIDLTWLLTGRGNMRGAGQLPGAALADVVMVDQYDPKASLAVPVLINQVPFSRNYLERTLRLNEPDHASLLVVESVWDLFDTMRGDLLLIDRKQADLVADGVYLLNLPGFSLRSVFTRPQGRLQIIEPQSIRNSTVNRYGRRPRDQTPHSYELDRRELLGDGRQVASKVVGRAVWVGHAI